ncbi:hypothetical protein EDC04DRAFT_2896525 [Pisolithus marmoratus]|nr:hypothetical protein EDC04DRAFT_2896525 [Pisolithus marmoratus]
MSSITLICTVVMRVLLLMPLSPYLLHILPHCISLPVVGSNPVESCPRLQGKESLQAPLESKWEEPNLPDVPKPHSLFVTTWWEADTNLQRIKSGVMDPGYCFPKPMLFVNVSIPEKKKTYLLNWLSAHLLWISQVDIHLQSKFPSPQMWRDFLNTIDTDPLPSTKTASTKLAMQDILGQAIINSAQGLIGAP